MSNDSRSEQFLKVLDNEGVLESMVQRVWCQLEKLKAIIVTLGLIFEYKVQKEPNALSGEFVVEADYIDDSSVCMILVANLFYGASFIDMLKNMKKCAEGLHY